MPKELTTPHRDALQREYDLWRATQAGEDDSMSMNIKRMLAKDRDASVDEAAEDEAAAMETS